MKETQLEKYIRLLVPEKLEKSDSKRWFDIVRDYGPDNIIGSIQTRDNEDQPRNVQMISKTFADGIHSYEIPLTRSLLEVELGDIVMAWADSFEGDFQIDSDSEFLDSLRAPNV